VAVTIDGAPRVPPVVVAASVAGSALRAGPRPSRFEHGALGPGAAIMAEARCRDPFAAGLGVGESDLDLGTRAAAREARPALKRPQSTPPVHVESGCALTPARTRTTMEREGQPMRWPRFTIRRMMAWVATSQGAKLTSVLPFVITSVVLALACSRPESPRKTDAAALVARLGSGDPLTRDAASSALRALGPAALPALRAARHGNVPALQPRAAALMRAIHQDQLIQPRTIALDYKGVAMSEVIKDLTERTGCPVTINPAQTEWLATRITLRTPAPVPFWSAVDKVCDAGRFGSNLGWGGGVSVAIFRGYSSGPVSDHGPFRVQLYEITLQGRHRKLHLKPTSSAELEPNLDEHDAGKSFIEVHVNVEPRVLLKNAGKLKNLTAEDDLGQSLIPPDPLSKQRDFEYGFTPLATTVARIPLAQDKKRGRRIKILRGVAPVAVGGLRAEPIVIPLLGAEGKTFEGDETAVTVRSVTKRPAAERFVFEHMGPDGKVEKAKTRPDQRMAVLLTIRPTDPKAAAPDLSEEQFTVVDASGKVWTAIPRIMTGTEPEVHVSAVDCLFVFPDEDLAPMFPDEDLAPMPWPRDLKGVALHYREMTVVPADVPFEFKDVPLP
jgi:hypothetical protein